MNFQQALNMFQEVWMAQNPELHTIEVWQAALEPLYHSEEMARPFLDHNVPGWDEPNWYEDQIFEPIEDSIFDPLEPVYDIKGLPDSGLEVSPSHTRSGARYGRQFLEESFDSGYETAVESLSDAELSMIEDSLILEPVEEAGGVALGLWLIPIAMAAIGLYIDYRVGKYFYEKIKDMTDEDFEDEDEEGKRMLRLMQNFSSKMVQHNYIGERAQRLGPRTMVSNWITLNK
jgi:hypothetical protein